MNLSLQALVRAARDTLVDPAAAARRVMSLNLSVSEGVMAITVTAASATLLTVLLQGFFGPINDPGMQNLFSRPFLLAFSQFTLMLVGAFLMWRVGQMFGGIGTFAQALSLVAWLEVVLILIQATEVLVLFFLPILVFPVALASLFAFFYLLTHFTVALNSYTSLAKTFFGIIGTALAVLLLTSFVLVFFLPVPANV